MGALLSLLGSPHDLLGSERGGRLRGGAAGVRRGWGARRSRSRVGRGQAALPACGCRGHSTSPGKASISSRPGPDPGDHTNDAAGRNGIVGGPTANVPPLRGPAGGAPQSIELIASQPAPLCLIGGLWPRRRRSLPAPSQKAVVFDA